MLEKSFILKALQKGELDLQGQFLNGSNYTFLVKLDFESVDMVTVYKPVRGEQPLWDFPAGSLAKREVAAYQVSELLGWELVPPTIIRRKAPLGAGSLQYYIDHNPEDHYFNFIDHDKQRLRPVVVFDLIINNADRKGSHILRDTQDHLWLIDHGICFNRDDKLRTVVWDFCGEPVPEDLLRDLARFIETLEIDNEATEPLRKLLLPGELAALARRTRRLMEKRVFPFPSKTSRPYPWPPV
jgi:Phosphatidylinositol 3- and 4-kinase